MRRGIYGGCPYPVPTHAVLYCIWSSSMRWIPVTSKKKKQTNLTTPQKIRILTKNGNKIPRDRFQANELRPCSQLPSLESICPGIIAKFCIVARKHKPNMPILQQSTNRLVNLNIIPRFWEPYLYPVFIVKLGFI